MVSSSILHQNEAYQLASPTCKAASTRHNSSQPYTVEDSIPKSAEGDRSTDSTLFLHRQHQSTTMICLFLRLFMVRIFPNTADQAKNVTLKVALFRQILPRQRSTIMRNKDFVVWSNIEQTSLGRYPQSLSPPPRRNLKKYNKLKVWSWVQNHRVYD